MLVLILLMALAGGPALQAQVFDDGPNPGAELRLFTDQFRHGSYLGIMLHDIDTDRAKALKLDEPRGVEVAKVEKGSPAEKAGLKPQDVLLSYNGESILGAQELVRLVGETPPGRKIKIEYWRDGKTQTATVTTESPQGHLLARSPGFPHFDMPDMRALAIPEIPATLLVWKSPSLGIECEPVSSQLADYFGVKQGVLVRSVTKDSAADRAGLKAGDVVTSFGDRAVSSCRDVTAFLRKNEQPRKAIPVVLMRNHKELTLTLVPSENEQ